VRSAHYTDSQSVGDV